MPLWASYWYDKQLNKLLGVFVVISSRGTRVKMQKGGFIDQCDDIIIDLIVCLLRYICLLDKTWNKNHTTYHVIWHLDIFPRHCDNWLLSTDPGVLLDIKALQYTIWSILRTSGGETCQFSTQYLHPLMLHQQASNDASTSKSMLILRILICNILMYIVKISVQFRRIRTR